MSKSTYISRLLLYTAAFVCFWPVGLSVAQKRDQVKSVYVSQIGVREATGHNDGRMVETYLHYCRLAKGNPWCASFVCWTLGQSSVTNPRSGYCPDLFLPKKVVWKRTSRHASYIPQPGDVFGLYFPEKGRVAHVGFIEYWGAKYAITVEGNTNLAGSREGDGVYRKRRPISSIYIIASYIN